MAEGVVSFSSATDFSVLCIFKVKAHLAVVVFHYFGKIVKSEASVDSFFLFRILTTESKISHL